MPRGFCCRTILPKTIKRLWPLSYGPTVVGHREMALQEVRNYLIGEGFDKEKVRYVFKSRKGEIAAAIIDQTQEATYDVIVLNHKPGKVTRFFTGSVFTKVVTALRDITVCIVS